MTNIFIEGLDNELVLIAKEIFNTTYVFERKILFEKTNKFKTYVEPYDWNKTSEIEFENPYDI